MNTDGSSVKLFLLSNSYYISHFVLFESSKGTAKMKQMADP